MDTSSATDATTVRPSRPTLCPLRRADMLRHKRRNCGSAASSPGSGVALGLGVALRAALELAGGIEGVGQKNVWPRYRRAVSRSAGAFRWVYRAGPSVA